MSTLGGAMSPTEVLAILVIGGSLSLAVCLCLAVWKRRFKVALCWGSIGLLFSAGFVLAWSTVVDPGLAGLLVKVDNATEEVSFAPIAWLLLCASVGAFATYKYRGKAQSISFLAASLVSAPAWLALAAAVVAFGSLPLVHY
jgi:hypothetical protein